MSDTLYIELTADGAPRRSSDGAEAWLDDARLEALRAEVDIMESQGVRKSNRKIGDRHVRVVAVNGGRGPGYLAAISETPARERRPADKLTPRQLEVAEHAADGTTVEDIGERLDISPNTVKQHLKNIYQRLGIGSRVELARRLSS